MSGAVEIELLRFVRGELDPRRQAEFAAFAAANPDLMTKSVLVRWYSPERLASEAARATFLLPDLPGQEPVRQAP